MVNGRKVWISTAQVTEKMLLLARTTPLEDVKKPTDGLSLFYTNLDRPYVDVKEIEKLGRKAVDSNELFIDNLPIPQEDLIGEEVKVLKLVRPRCSHMVALAMRRNTTLSVTSAKPCCCALRPLEPN